MAALYGLLTAPAVGATAGAASAASAAAITGAAGVTVGGTTVGTALGLVGAIGLGVGLAVTGIGIAGVAGEEAPELDLSNDILPSTYDSNLGVNYMDFM